MNLPNRISIFRLILIPLIVLVWIFPYAQFNIELPVYYVGTVSISLKNIISLIIFVIASLSDMLDGMIARKTNQITTFGKFIDPIADKCLTTTLFIIFVANNTISFIPVMIMIWRDTIVDGVRQIAASKNFVMAAGKLGKLKTASQMICIILILLNNLPFELISVPVADILLWFSALISMISGIDYFMQAKEIILKDK
ncbi:MAG: CDP-diacylglycerol--glycerol-3-phosphate 3-phosphatidyltransferase [Erysipelotrichia bacterium]|nr:CDP-diacylglycerol--glycerol-3-phosphate 3-phosphatidyltransferase [Erysipelotrichia bacterium]